MNIFFTKTSDVIIFLLILCLLTSCRVYKIDKELVVGLYKNKDKKGLSTKLEISNNDSFLFEINASGSIYKYCRGTWSIENNNLKLECLSDSTVFDVLSIGYMGQYQQLAKFKSINRVKIGNVQLERVSN